MKKRTGFTLVELLAVIIILAIVALIATPVVLNVIEDSKETARKGSILGYADGVRTAVYDSGSALIGRYSEVNKEWAEANVTIDSDKVDCEEVRFSDSFETVLHKCRVGESNKEYCFAGGKTYEDCEDTEYKSIYDSLPVPPKPLVTELIKQYKENNTVGLLKDNTGYYYKGTNEEVSNNFVWFGGHLWRVIGIDNDNNLTMITQQPITSIQLTSKAWGNEQEYKESYINTWLNEVFLNSLEESDRNKIINNTFNVGNSLNISNIITTQKIGLLSDNQYSKGGAQNSYLDIKSYFWLGYVRYDSTYNSYFFREVGQQGTVSAGSDPTPALGVRPVIKTSNLTFIVGKGTLDDPYRENSTTTNTSNIKIGEYVSVPTTGNDCGTDKKCLFRVVSKDNNSIKVILNGLLPSTSQFGSSVTYTSGNTIDTKVKAFAGTISDTYRYTGMDKTFGIGEYPYVKDVGQDYKMVKNTTYTGNVGLPVSGEMFTANDIDLSTSSTKTFVNVATIENPTVSYNFWTMNSFGSGYVRTIFYNGNLNYDSGPTSSIGVRPVLFLNNNLTFTSGEGTAENPFILE